MIIIQEIPIEKVDEFWDIQKMTRELCALGLRKRENYRKDAIEGIFE